MSKNYNVDDKCWRKVFEILEWSGSHIIQFAGCQDLIKELKTFISSANKCREELKFLEWENTDLKEHMKVLQRQVSYLEACQRDGTDQKAEVLMGNLKRSFRDKEVTCKRKLLKLAESFRNEDGDDDDVALTEVGSREGDNEVSEEIGDSSVETAERSIQLVMNASGSRAGVRSGSRSVSGWSSVSGSGSWSPPSSKSRSKSNSGSISGPGSRSGSRSGSCTESESDANEDAPAKGHAKLVSSLPDVPNPQQLSSDLESFFKLVTGGFLGSSGSSRATCTNDKKRKGVKLLLRDKRINGILPKLIPFISERVKENEEGNNLKNLHTLMKMVKDLLSNPILKLKFHQAMEIKDCVLKCVIGPHSLDGSWVLRDFSSTLLACYLQTASTDQRIITEVREALESTLADANAPFTSIYGAVATICQLGDDDILKEDLIPKLRQISDRLQSLETDSDNPVYEKREAQVKIWNLIEKYLT